MNENMQFFPCNFLFSSRVHVIFEDYISVLSVFAEMQTNILVFGILFGFNLICSVKEGRQSNACENFHDFSFTAHLEQAVCNMFVVCFIKLQHVT
jgi:hypothetical protein